MKITNEKEVQSVGLVTPNTLVHGDCLEVMKYIPDGSVDCILCDIPYGITEYKLDTVIPFEPMWKQVKRIIKKHGATVLFGSEPFSSYLRMSNIKEYKYDWYWNKGQGVNFVTAKYRPLNDTECISVFSKGKTNYYPVMENAKLKNIRPINKGSSANKILHRLKKAKSDKNYNPNKRYPKTSININSRAKECNSLHRVHPMQKPVELGRYLIKTYTKEGEVVLDFTSGSGSFGVAAVLENRQFIGIEKDEKYFHIMEKRINAINTR